MATAAVVVAATLTVPVADAAVADARTELVSTGPGSPIDDGVEPSISADGWHVAFTSVLPLDPRDTGTDNNDVYVHDRGRRATVLISQLPEGVKVDVVQASQPSISATGRYVAFETNSPRMGTVQDPDAETDAYVADVYVCDRDPDGDGDFDEVLPDGSRDYAYAFAGVKLVTDGVRSVTTAPSISADGGSVAWVLRPEGNRVLSQQFRVWVTRLAFGLDGRLLPTPLATVEVAPTAASSIQRARQPVISADGDYVTVLADWPDTRFTDGRIVGIVPGDRQPRREDVVSVDENGAVLETVDLEHSMSGDARLIAFEYDEFVVRLVDRDPDGDGVLWPAASEPFTSEVVSDHKRSGEADTRGSEPALSHNGRFLAFTAPGSAVEGRTPDCSYEPEGCPQSISALGSCGEGGCQVVVRDLVVDRARAAAGLPPGSAHVVSQSDDQDCVPSPAGWPTGPCLGNDDSGRAGVSSDGGVVAFESWADDLVSGGSTGFANVFTRVFTPGVSGSAPRFAPVRTGEETTSVVQVSHDNGFGPADITSVTITGTDSDQFAVHPADTCSGRTLYAGDSCGVSVAFRPSGTGDREAQAVVNVRDRSEPLVVPLRGTAEAAPPPPPSPPSPPTTPQRPPPAGPVLTVSPVDASFGGRAITATSDPTLIRVVNRGDTALTVSSVGISPIGGAVPETAHDYRVVLDACTGTVLQPGDECVVSVVHSPRAQGERAAALLVTGSDGQSRLVLLRGSGDAPAVSAVPPVGARGRPTTVLGKGFPAGMRLELSSPGHLERATATVRPDGTFTAQLLLFSSTRLGTRTIQAKVVAPDVTAEADTAYLVTAGRMAPPGFIWRR